MDKRIIGFLIRAKKATYAGKGAETASSRPASHDLVYKEDDLMYLDTYLGGGKFEYVILNTTQNEINLVNITGALTLDEARELDF